MDILMLTLTAFLTMASLWLMVGRKMIFRPSRILGWAFLFFGMVFLSLFAQAADAVAAAAPAASGMAMLAHLGGILASALFKTVGAGTALKFILSFKVGGDELIHRIPEGIRPLATTALAVLIFIPYVLFSGAYSCAGCDVQLQADLVGVLGAGTSANTVHNLLSTWFPPKAQE